MYYVYLKCKMKLALGTENQSMVFTGRVYLEGFHRVGTHTTYLTFPRDTCAKMIALPHKDAF